MGWGTSRWSRELLQASPAPTVVSLGVEQAGPALMCRQAGLTQVATLGNLPLSVKGKKDDHGPDRGLLVVGDMLKMPIAWEMREV